MSEPNETTPPTTGRFSRIMGKIGEVLAQGAATGVDAGGNPSILRDRMDAVDKSRANFRVIEGGNDGQGR